MGRAGYPKVGNNPAAAGVLLGALGPFRSRATRSPSAWSRFAVGRWLIRSTKDSRDAGTVDPHRARSPISHARTLPAHAGAGDDTFGLPGTIPDGGGSSREGSAAELDGWGVEASFVGY